MATGVPFHLLRCGTSRGPFFWGHMLPRTPAARDAFLCAAMGSGSPGQVDGVGGGDAVTSKAVFLNRAPATDAAADVEFNFAQVGVMAPEVNHSHGDCLNMLAGVAPFVLSTTTSMGFGTGTPGGARPPSTPGTSAAHPLRIRSMETGLLAEQWIVGADGTAAGDAVYSPGRSRCVATRMVGCAGAMTGARLPGGAATIALGAGLPRVSVVDFSRVMVIVDAADVGLDAASDLDLNDPVLCGRLETIRLAAAAAAGLGDCGARESPKVCVVAAPMGSTADDGHGMRRDTRTPAHTAAQLHVWYWVNPGRREGHPSLAITGASCLAAACEIPGSIPHGLIARSPTAAPAVWASAGSTTSAGTAGGETAEYTFAHGLGHRRVTLWREAGALPHGVAYSNNVRTLARGELFVEDGAGGR